MKSVTFKRIKAYRGVAGAFCFQNTECIIMAKTAEDVAFIRSLIRSVTGEPDVYAFKKVILTSAEPLESKT